MADYNADNYTEQGGDRSVINGIMEIDGTLVFGENAKIKNMPKATLTEVGGIIASPYVTSCAAADISQVNSWLNNKLMPALRAAGVIQIKIG